MIYPSITKFKGYVELKDFRPPTKKRYVHYVWQLTKHHDRDPASLSEDQVRGYFLFLREEQHTSPSLMKGHKYALRCFYRDCLRMDNWTVFDEVRIAPVRTLPVILSRQEIAQLFSQVRQQRFAICLRLMYHCGLRVGEAVSLQVRDIRGRQQPPCLHIRDGKGGKDRYVPIAEAMVEELRQWWQTHRHPQLIFPAYGRGSQMGIDSVQEVFRQARLAAGITPPATPHTLRHSYATHLLEQGVSLIQIQKYLGHARLATTAIYLHLTAVSEARTQVALAALYQPSTNYRR